MKTRNIDLYYEDVQVGDVFVTPSRTITESDVMLFAGLTGDYLEVHTSAGYASLSMFEEQVAQGTLLLSIANGFYSRLGYFSKTDLALVGLSDWRFVAPVMFKDTVYLRMTLKNKRLTSKPGRGLFVWDYKLYCANEQLCAQGEVTRLIACRELGAHH